MKLPKPGPPSLCTSINTRRGGPNIWASKGYLRGKRIAPARGSEGEERRRVPTAAWRLLPHRGSNGNQQPLAAGPMLTGPVSDHSSFCPRIRFCSAPALRGQWKKFQVCLADVNGFSVIPGILLGGGRMQGTGPPLGTARHFFIRLLHTASRLHVRHGSGHTQEYSDF